jgi:hypothetical protein
MSIRDRTFEPLRIRENVGIGLRIRQTKTHHFVPFAPGELRSSFQILALKGTEHPYKVHCAEGAACAGLNNHNRSTNLRRTATDLPDLFTVQNLGSIGVTDHESPRAYILLGGLVSGHIMLYATCTRIARVDPSEKIGSVHARLHPDPLLRPHRIEPF